MTIIIVGSILFVILFRIFIKTLNKLGPAIPDYRIAFIIFPILLIINIVDLHQNEFEIIDVVFDILFILCLNLCFIDLHRCAKKLLNKGKGQSGSG